MAKQSLIFIIIKRMDDLMPNMQLFDDLDLILTFFIIDLFLFHPDY